MPPAARHQSHARLLQDALLGDAVGERVDDRVLQARLGPSVVGVRIDLVVAQLDLVVLGRGLATSPVQRGEDGCAADGQ